ncbi:DNA polymerase, partial [Treponema sp. R6D11]
KKERYIAKNGFVFPIFYGASAKSMAPNIWELCGPDEKKRFRAMGVKTVTELQEHIKEMENKFWNVRFKKYGQWRRKTYNEFLAKGYLKVNTGFYCYAPCEFTQLVNRAIQGSACHCLLFSLLNAEPRIRKATNGRSFLVGQIHDSIIGDIHPGDLETVNAIVKECGIAKVKKKWEFITTPLEIEYACTPVDGSLSELKEIGKLV